MHIKKVISILLIALMLLTGLSSCKTSDAPPSAPQIPSEDATASVSSSTSDHPLDPETNTSSSLYEDTTMSLEVAEPIDTTPEVTDPPYSEEVLYSGAIKDYFLPLENYSYDRLYDPEFIMIHFSSAIVIDKKDPYNVNTIRNIFLKDEVSTHYIIERDGTIRCYIPENRVAWHAGKGTFLDDPKYTNKMNHYAIGIELIGMGSKSDMSIYLSGKTYDAIDDSLKCFTDEQYEALTALVLDICVRNNIPMDRSHIIGHSDYSPSKKDPGQLFEWNRLLK